MILKKVVIDPKDFDKIVVYITTMPVKFNSAAQAVEINSIFRKVEVMDIEIKEPENNNT